MDYAVLDPAQRALRDEVFHQTAELRVSLAGWRQNGPVARDHLLRMSAALAASSRQARIPHLESWADLLHRFTTLASYGAIADGHNGIRTALGLFESVVEPCIEGLTRSRIERVDAALRGCVPEDTRRWLDIEAGNFAKYIEQLQSPPAPIPVPATPIGVITPAPAALPAAVAVATTVTDDDDLSRELVAAFREEVAECFERCDSLLVHLEKADDPSSQLAALFREFHTMKGAAAAVDLEAAAAQLHQGESLLQSLRDGDLDLDRSALVDFLFRLLDSVKGLIAQSLGESVDPTSVISNLEGELASLFKPEAEAPAPPPLSRPAAKPAPPTEDESRAQDQGAVLADLRRKAAAGQLDPQLLALIDALDERARHYSQVAASLQEEVDHLRAVTAEVVLRRLERPVRDAARQENKLVELFISGEDVRVPRGIADRIAAPLLHLVRNAVAHGIEAPAMREAAGKPRVGRIDVSVRAEGSEIIVSVQDDGGGLDLEAIRAKAASRGWVEPDRALDEHVFIPFLFRPGFSTRSNTSELAGRGVGLDVVAAEVEAMNGWIEVDSKPGLGTGFTIYVARGAGEGR